MRNAEIAAAFDELATLYELDGAVRYRVLAYRDAARTVRDCPVSVAELARGGRATELPGIGKTLEQKIVTLLDEGEIPSAVRLKQRFPPTLIAVTRVPGLGAKTARRLFDELEIASLEDLKAAAEAGRIRELRGLGPKNEENILAALGRMDGDGAASGRLLLSDVLPVAEELAEALREHPAADRVEVAGSARRRAETCKDIDLIATASDPEELAAAFVSHPLISAGGSGGPNGARALTHNGVPVDLRIVAPEEFGNLLQHFTGSAAHNVELREDAVGRGLSVSEHGIAETESGEVLRCASEEEVYDRLGYAYIEPELREGRGELRAAREGKLPELVSINDIRGNLHCHTTLSDGHNSLEEMADAARALGYVYLAVTDHSATHGFGNHVTADQLWERVAEVRELDARLPRFHLMAGSEVNIGIDGSLDYPDDLQAELDWVIGSLHTRFSGDEEKNTERILAAIENPHVDCIGHLTGRMLGRREPYPVDVEAIAAAAAANGTMLEINANPNRRDLSEHHARLALDAGARIVINTDAHRVRTLNNNMAYGIATARRAWMTKAEVANTRPWREFQKLRKR